MENTIPTAEEFVSSAHCDHLSESQRAVEFARLHVEAQRKMIDAKIKHHFPREFWEDVLDLDFVLHCYPSDNIK